MTKTGKYLQNTKAAYDKTKTSIKARFSDWDDLDFCKTVFL